MSSRPRLILSLALSTLALLAPPRPAEANTWPTCGNSCGTTITGGLVTGAWTAAGSPYCIQSNVTLAGLTIGPGVCVRVSPGVTITVLAAVTASGTDVAPITFLAAQQSPLARWGGIVFQNVPAGSSLTWCRILDSNNAGLTINDSSPTISHCWVEGNKNLAGSGGGVVVNLITVPLVTLSDCVIRGNATNGHGGGLNAVIGANRLVLQRCILADNLANEANAAGNYFGGAAFINGNSRFENCEIYGNRVQVCIACNNCNVYSRGGAVYSDLGVLELANCVLRENWADSHYCWGQFSASWAYGGAIYVHGGSLLATNTILSSNTATSNSGNYGSGLFLNAGTALLENCTMVNGNAGVPAIYTATGAATTAHNSIVFYNNLISPGVYGPQFHGLTPTVDYCDLQNWTGAGTGIITTGPVFAGTGNDQSNVKILSYSPCVDAGDPAAAFDDTCHPPSLGTVVAGHSRNDIGAHGGPGARNWVDASAMGGWINYCMANPNTTGQPARIWALGSSSIAANNFTLCATNLPPNTPGIFFYGTLQTKSVFGAGFRCVAGTTARLLPPAYASASGVATRVFNLQNVPAAVPIAPGDTRHFQYWYRNPLSTVAPFNLTDGLQVFFTP